MWQKTYGRVNARLCPASAVVHKQLARMIVQRNRRVDALPLPAWPWFAHFARCAE
jgi:hypothetical protein